MYGKNKLLLQQYRVTLQQQKLILLAYIKYILVPENYIFKSFKKKKIFDVIY